MFIFSSTIFCSCSPDHPHGFLSFDVISYYNWKSIETRLRQVLHYNNICLKFPIMWFLQSVPNLSIESGTLMTAFILQESKFLVTSITTMCGKDYPLQPLRDYVHMGTHTHSADPQSSSSLKPFPFFPALFPAYCAGRKQILQVKYIKWHTYLGVKLHNLGFQGRGLV